MPEPLPPSRPWWQAGVIYQVYPRSFQDTNGDGVGDLAGIRSRLDHLQWLGVDAMWISPIFPSPMADFGYDVSDYCGIHPLFGTFEDFDTLVEAAHERGIRVLLDYVPDHTSDRHSWFEESRSSLDDPKRDYYIWHDPAPNGGPPNNWLSHFGGSAWEFDPPTGQYYLHSFLKEQPDLNWRNDEVRSAMLDVLRFWCERGVDGFRIDVLYQIVKDSRFRDDPPNPDWTPIASPHDRLIHVYSQDQPEVHDIIREMRAMIDRYGDRCLLAEIWLPVERLMSYYGRGRHGVQLPLNFLLASTAWNARSVREAVEAYERALPDGDWPDWVLGDHDTHRVASRIGHDQARVAALLLLTLRGTPILYYGDEIGMADVPIQAERVHDPLEKNLPGLGLGRDPERTPMQWDGSATAGFTTGEPWLPVGDTCEGRNVADARDDPGSMLTLYRALIDLRRREPALSVGDYREHAVSDTTFAWLRGHEGRRFLVAANLSHGPAAVDLADLTGTVVLTTDGHGTGEHCEGTLMLAGDRGVVVRLDR